MTRHAGPGRAELEKKRAKLQELRRAREEKQQQQQRASVGAGASSTRPAAPYAAATDHPGEAAGSNTPLDCTKAPPLPDSLSTNVHVPSPYARSASTSSGARPLSVADFVLLDLVPRSHTNDAQTEMREGECLQETLALNVLTDQEQSTIAGSEDFLHFLQASSLRVEKALAEPYDALKAFSFEPATEGAPTGAGETTAPSSPPDGLILVWSKHLTTRPEVVLQAPTAMMCAMFAPHHPNLVVGAGHSGQIFLWDLRSPRNPLLQTPLSGMAHSHPVLSMSMIGSPASCSLVTISDDGRLCSWTLDQLAQPQETLDLVHPMAEGADVEEVAVACAAFQPAETAAFWVGEEGGMLYRVDRYDQATSKAGVLHQPLEGGHETLVTALHFHPMERYKHLLLSCSADWTIKLWDVKHFGTRSVVRPLHALEHREGHVLDVRWSPCHPAVLAAVDGAGNLHVYNLLQDEESPVLSKPVDHVNPVALNKLRWSQRGDEVVVGSSDGRVHVFTLDQALVHASAEASAAFRRRYC